MKVEFWPADYAFFVDRSGCRHSHCGMSDEDALWISDGADHPGWIRLAVLSPVSVNRGLSAVTVEVETALTVAPGPASIDRVTAAHITGAALVWRLRIAGRGPHPRAMTVAAIDELGQLPHDQVRVRLRLVRPI